MSPDLNQFHSIFFLEEADNGWTKIQIPPDSGRNKLLDTKDNIFFLHGPFNVELILTTKVNNHSPLLLIPTWHVVGLVMVNMVVILMLAEDCAKN